MFVTAKSLPPSQIVPTLAERGEYGFGAKFSLSITCCTTEVKLSKEISIKNPQVIPLTRRMKCGVGKSATWLQRL
ncbi:MAG: hypothetical protein ACI9YH_005038 [Colwellia sp.]|jgi:hypothetical protein